ncbi:DUF4031 domain-containing protein [Oerskovia sp. M15]
MSDSSLEELHAFAEHMGLGRRAFDLDHYDVAAERHADCIAAGGLDVTGRELIVRLRASGLRVPARERTAAKAAAVSARWESILPGLPGARKVGEDLVRRWHEPHRAYHGPAHLTHVLDSLAVLEDRAPGVPARGEPTPSGTSRRAQLALWFHDAVHEGVAGDDEEASAELATSLLTPLVHVGPTAEHTRALASPQARRISRTRTWRRSPASSASPRVTTLPPTTPWVRSCATRTSRSWAACRTATPATSARSAPSTPTCPTTSSPRAGQRCWSSCWRFRRCSAPRWDALAGSLVRRRTCGPSSPGSRVRGPHRTADGTARLARVSEEQPVDVAAWWHWARPCSRSSSPPRSSGCRSAGTCA